MEAFALLHEFFAFKMKTRQIKEIEDAFKIMNLLGYTIKISKGMFLDVEYMVQIFVETYGKQQTAQYIENHLNKLMWDTEDKDKMNSVIAQMKENLQQ